MVHGLFFYATPGRTKGEANGTPLQYSCLENPMEGGAWWAAVHGVAKSQTWLERLHFHSSLSCIGEGNGNPLQCSCLENPRDGGAWWAAIYGVAQSQTRLKWLSSSSRKNQEGSQEVRCREGESKLTKFQQGYPCQKLELSPSGNL